MKRREQDLLFCPHAERKRLLTERAQPPARVATHLGASIHMSPRCVLQYMQRGAMLLRRVLARRDRAGVTGCGRVTRAACRLRAPHDCGWGGAAAYGIWGHNGEFRCPRSTRL